MSGGLGVGAIVTLRADARHDWWVITGHDDKPGVGRRVQVGRWIPDAWVQAGPGQWWEYTEVDTTRLVWWFQLAAVVFPAVRPWSAGVS